jgi:hypothetical protein
MDDTSDVLVIRVVAFCVARVLGVGYCNGSFVSLSGGPHPPSSDFQ